MCSEFDSHLPHIHNQRLFQQHIFIKQILQHLMKRIEYTNHLKLRLEIRKIPFEYPKEIFEKPDKLFFDNIEKRHIAIKRLKYNKKFRNLLIAFDIFKDRIEIVTIHPISDEKILNRIISERWKENEKI